VNPTASIIKKILLAEDDEDDFVITRDLFSEMAGGRFTLDWTKTFEEALERMALNRHDVCLVDYRLGAQNGIELLRAALESGAQMVNDVSGGRADESMADLLAEADVPWVLMHWRSVSSDHPHQVPPYRDVVAEVRAELLACVDDAVAAGVDPAKLIIDPGLGFAKSGQHNWALLHALPELVATGIPVLVGASRKRFLGSLLAGPDGAVRPPDGRETATAVVSALAALHGAWGVRVHDARASVDAVKVVEAWTQAGAVGSDG